MVDTNAETTFQTTKVISGAVTKLDPSLETMTVGSYEVNLPPDGQLFASGARTVMFYPSEVLGNIVNTFSECSLTFSANTAPLVKGDHITDFSIEQFASDYDWGATNTRGARIILHVHSDSDQQVYLAFIYTTNGTGVKTATSGSWSCQGTLASGKPLIAGYPFKLGSRTTAATAKTTPFLLLKGDNVIVLGFAVASSNWIHIRNITITPVPITKSLAVGFQWECIFSTSIDQMKIAKSYEATTGTNTQDSQLQEFAASLGLKVEAEEEGKESEGLASVSEKLTVGASVNLSGKTSSTHTVSLQKSTTSKISFEPISPPVGTRAGTVMVWQPIITYFVYDTSKPDELTISSKIEDRIGDTFHNTSKLTSMTR